MQCTSRIPAHYNERDLNVGATGFSRYLLNGHTNYGQERGSDISVTQCTIEQYLGYEKDVMRRIIQNHEATFRYQVQELHKLYARQRVLMDEISEGEIFSQHLQLQTSQLNLCSSQARSHISQSSHNASWLIGHQSDGKVSVQSSENILERNNEFKAPSCRSKGHEKRVFDLELPADIYDNNQERGLVKTGGDMSSLNTSSCKTKFLIDLNEPVELEMMDSSSDGTISSVGIDLNSMPLSCLSEPIIYPVNPQKNGDQQEKLDLLRAKSDCNSGIIWSSENEMPQKGSSGIDDNVLKIKTHIDLNSGVIIDEPFSLLPSTNVEGPVSPENKEGSPPRGNSEDITVITPLLSELDRTAANTLVMMFDSEDGNFCNNPLTWFAGIISSNGDDIDNEAIEQHKGATSFSCVAKKEGKTGTCSSRSRRGCARAKIRKSLKLDGARKSTSAVWKQPVTRSKHGVLQNWGNVKKRRGGRRCRTSKFLVNN